MKRFSFASDNWSGICPQASSAFIEANEGAAPAYGEDAWTERASNKIREIFECDCDLFFVFNGTAANSLALASLCQSYHSVLAHEHAHIETDECGGPEFFSHGTKILLIPGEHGKIDLDAAEQTVGRRTDIHYPKPKVMSVTQATEMGTVYSVDELQRLNEVKKRFGLSLHMDGARMANALASLGVSPSAVTWKVGVDVLCLGGAKNGLAVGECVIFFNPRLAEEFAYRCKQAGQLASKMRFISAPWLGLLENNVWLENAQHANQAAQSLEARLRQIPDIEVLHPVQANAVFIRFPLGVADALRCEGWQFYDFIGTGGSRLMCSWDTPQQAIDEFCTAVERVIPAHLP